MSNSTEQSFPIITGKKTDKGRTRDHNEDSCHVFTTTVHSERDPSRQVPAQVAIVADGIGGAEGGEKASRIAVETIEKQIHAGASTSSASQLLEPAIMRANDNINETRRTFKRFENMGTTVVAAIIADGRLYVSHAGDSRAYLIRQSQIEQLTVDHTWVQEAIEAGRLSVEGGLNHPNKNVVKRFLGTNEPLKVDNQIINFTAPKAANGLSPMMSSLALQPGDVILLCSDGLTDLVTDDEIKNMVNKHKNDPQTTADKLIDRANEKGGIDNISATVMTWQDGSKGAFLAPLWQKLLLGLAIVLLLLGGVWSIFAGSVDESAVAETPGIAGESAESTPAQEAGTEQEDNTVAVAPTTETTQNTNTETGNDANSNEQATSTAIVQVAQSTAIPTFTLAPGETREPETPTPEPTVDASSASGASTGTDSSSTTGTSTGAGSSSGGASTGTDSSSTSTSTNNNQPSGGSVAVTQSPPPPSATQNSAPDQNQARSASATSVEPSNTPRPNNTPVPAASATQQQADTSAPATAVPTTAVPPTQPPAATDEESATAVPPTAVPPTAIPPTAVPPTAIPPTAVPPTAIPPTAVPPTAVPPTQPPPPTAVPPTAIPPTQAPARNVGVSLSSPVQNATIKNNEVQFRVQVNGFEPGDRLQLRASIDRNNLFNEGISFSFDGSAHVANLGYQPGNAGFGKDYYWQVLVIGPDGSTLASSNIGQFRWEEPGGGGGDDGGGVTGGNSSGP